MEPEAASQVRDRFQLHEAILDNNLRLFRACIDDGADPNLDLKKLVNLSETEQEKLNQLVYRLHRFDPEFEEVEWTPINFTIINIWNDFATSVDPDGDSVAILNDLLEHAHVTMDCPSFAIWEHPTLEISPQSSVELGLNLLSASKTPNQQGMVMYAIASISKAATRHKKQLEQKRIEREKELRRLDGENYRTALLEKMLNNSENCDVTFICPDGERIMAHKAILSEAVPYFAAGFSNNWNATNEWKIDKPAHVIHRLLKYIYTGRADFASSLSTESSEMDTTDLPPEKKQRVNTDLTISLDVFSAAHEFHMEDLLKICEDQIVTMLSVSNLLDILDRAASLDASSLKLRCFQFMKENSVVLLSDHNLSSFAAQNGELWKEFQAFVGRG